MVRFDQFFAAAGDHRLIESDKEMVESRRAKFITYKPKTILNKGKRADHWFWTRYSAYPYIGCQHGCEFCYCREQKYSPYDDPQDFAYIIKVKENAAELLRKELSRSPIDNIFTGDYQAVERKFNISRKMLQVCWELGFPVFILERSPYVLRDLDLIKAIHHKARAVVAFSIVYTPESAHAVQVRQLEHLAPAVEKRFAAMRTLAEAGIPTGTCMMPILPKICDDPANLEAVVRWTADHGGQFVLAGGLTLADQQRQYFFNVLSERFPTLFNDYTKIYPPASYAPAGYDWLKVARQVRADCQKYGISDRQPRPIIPGDGRTFNRRVVEYLANQVYTFELDEAPKSRLWAYRKAAWAVEDLEQDLRLVYQRMGLKGLECIPDIGQAMAKVLESMILENLKTNPDNPVESTNK